MATRRMLSLQIADTDTFLDLKPPVQNLYTHICLRADDDGFLAGPKRVARMVGSSAEDYDALVKARFIIDFPKSGVCVVKHWRIHNQIRKDRHTPTQWVKELAMLHVDEATQKYQLRSEHPEVGTPPVVAEPATKPQPTVAKVTTKRVRVKKVATPKPPKVPNTEEQSEEEKQIAEVIHLFEVHNVNASASKWYGQSVQREACRLLLKKFGFDTVSKVIAILPKTNALPAYDCPSATTPNQLLEKWHLIETKLTAMKHKAVTAKPKRV